MITDLDKTRIFKSIKEQLDSLIVTKYEAINAHSDKTLNPTVVFMLLQMYKDGGKTFSYIVGGNNDAERVLFCLNRLHMIHTYNIYIRDHEAHVSCSLTNIGLTYVQSILNKQSPHRLIICQFLFDFCFEVMPFLLALMYVMWFGTQNPNMGPLCIACLGFGLFDIDGILHIQSKTGNRLVYRKLDDTKAQFIGFCDQHAVWYHIDPHALIHIIDRYMFNDHTYRKRSFVARHDVPWNSHYHG